MSKPKKKKRKAPFESNDSGEHKKKSGPSTQTQPSASQNYANRSAKLTGKHYFFIAVFFTILIGVPTAYYTYYRPVKVINIPYERIDEYDHDSRAFTQGFYYEDGFIYESTGNPENAGEDKPKNSWVRKVNLKTGSVVEHQDLPPKYFGEGLTIFKDKIYQLTWENRVVFVYDRAFNLLEEKEYPGSMWGLTHNDEHLIISNGSSVIKFVDPETLKEVRYITVKKGVRSVDKLNELEFIDGRIYANIWQQDIVVEIDPETGKVTGEIDLSGLWPRSERKLPSGIEDTDAVLNGIAYDPVKKHLLVTGKYWPTIYELKLHR